MNKTVASAAAVASAAVGASADKLTKHVAQFSEYLLKSSESFMDRWQKPPLDIGTIDDFQLLQTIGQGAFGIVLLAKHNDSGHMIALKLIEKKVTVKRSQVVHVKNEIKLMFCCKNPFLVRMQYFFRDNVYLYLGMPFVSGGEMYFHLRKLKRFEEPLAKFYTAQVVWSGFRAPQKCYIICQ